MTTTPLQRLRSHCARRMANILAADTQLLRLCMAIASAMMLAELMLPGEKLATHGYEILAPMRDLGLGTVCAVHTAGMLRSLFKLVERPRLDYWTNVLGACLFSCVGLGVDLSLWSFTLLGTGFLVLGAMSAWAAVRSGNGAEEVHA